MWKTGEQGIRGAKAPKRQRQNPVWCHDQLLQVKNYLKISVNKCDQVEMGDISCDELNVESQGCRRELFGSNSAWDPTATSMDQSNQPPRHDIYIALSQGAFP